MAGGDEEGGQGRVAQKGGPRPVPVFVPQFPITLRYDKRVPFVVHAPGRAPGVELQEVPGAEGVPGEQPEPEPPVLERQFDGKDDFAIVVRVDRGLVVFNMAGPEPDMVPPSQKREYPQKKLIQPLRLERRPVHEFMTGRPPEEGADGAMRKQGDKKDGQGPDPSVAAHLKEGQVGE